MTIQQFIEAAKEGGYNHKGGIDIYTTSEEILLSPEAWKAVGKVKEFKPRIWWSSQTEEIAEQYMFEMIYRLYRGGSLEEYIATL